MIARFITAVLACCVLAWPLLADDATDKVAPQEPLQFRRHLVPQAEVPERIRDGYMPIQRERFERMLAEINASSTAMAAEAPVRIEQATYSAKLEEDQLVLGTAELEILRTSDAASVLPLTPCQLALRRPIWTNDNTAARVGVDPTGQLVVLADRSATLQFTWTLRGERDKRGHLAFQLQLPHSAMNHLTLDLPGTMKPTVDVGFAELVKTEGATSADAGDARMEPSDVVATGRRTWSIELGGNSNARLVIEPENVPLSQRQLVLARQSTAYRFTEAGLEVRAHLTLDVHHQPLERLELDIHPTLQIIAARLGETEIPVRSLRQSEAVTRIALDLPQPTIGVGREVVLQAFAPLKTDRLWRLPLVRPVDVVWRQGNAKLEIRPGLVLKRLITEACIETSVEPLPATSKGETRNLLLYQPDANMDVLLSFEPPEIAIDCGTSIRLNENLVSGRLVAHVTSTRGSIFQLDARSQDGWIIDRVETIPAGALAGYASRRARQVRIRLGRALRPGQDLRVVVTAHRRLPSTGPPMNGSDFRILNLGRVPRGRELMSIYAEPPYHLTVAGDAELSHLPLQDLSEEERDMIDTQAGAYVYRDSPAARSLSLGLRREDPRYSAAIAVKAMVESQTLKQTYAIRCEPSASRVARLAVRFSQPSDGSTVWQLDGESDNGLTAVRLEAADTTGHGETWEINLHRPRSEPFEILATHSAKLETEASLSLASLPEATSQEATLEIGTRDGTPFHVRADNLKSVPPPTLPYGARYPTTRAMYRYDPSRDAVAVVTRAPPEEAQPAAWIWSARLVSRWESHGEATHEAFYFLENTGRSHVVLVVPEHAANVRCTVQDEEVCLSSASTPAARQWIVRLPKEVRYATVRVTFATEGPRLGMMGEVRPTWPQLDLPCFDKTWSVWLPPGFAAVADDRLLRPAFTGPIRWDERLFGRRLLRQGGQPFDLFSSTDWQHLTQTLTHDRPTDSAVRSVQAWERLCGEWMERTGKHPTWGDLITAYEQARETEANDTPGRRLPALLVDDEMLRRLEITPDTELPDLDASSTGLLKTLHLSIIAAETDVLLTGENALGSGGRLVQLPNTANMVTVRNAFSMQDPLGTPATRRSWMTAREWIETPPTQLGPWPEARRCETLEIPLAGWNHCQLQVALEEARPLTVYQPKTLDVIGWGMLLMVAGWIGWLVKRRPLVLVFILATSGAIALVCPVVWIPVARGLFIGALLGTALVLVRLPVRATSKWPTSETTETMLIREPGTSRIANSILLAALISGGFVAGPASGQAPANEQAAQRQAFPLLVPVDDDGQPAGDYFFLPRPFYEAIHRRSVSANVSPRAWLVQSAMYRVTVAEEGEGNTPSVEIVAEFDLEVFQPDTRVRFPFRREGIRLVEATLDGQTIETRWDPDGAGMILDVDTPRRLRLALSFQPLVLRSGANSGFDITIPQVARSRARIKTSNDVGEIEVLAARGAVSRDADQGEVSVDLGPASRLSVRWPKAGQVDDASADVEVSELFVLRAQPNSVVLDAQFRFSVRAGSLREIQLIADPRLRLLPLPTDQPAIRHFIEEGATRTIRFELDRPYDDEVTIQATFLLDETRGIGNLAIPRIQAVANRRLRPWLGVWTAPGLDIQVPSELQANSVGIPDFAAIWPEATPLPQHAFRLPPDEPPRILAIHPAQPRAEVSQDTDVSVGVDRAMVSLHALLTLDNGHFLQRTLTIPQGLDVQEVHVTRDGEDRAKRWADDGNGNLTVFFDRPLKGEHTLLLRGETPAPKTLPNIFVQDATTQSHAIRVFRQPGVQVEIQQVQGLEIDTAAVAGAYHAGLGRLVAAYKANSDTEAPPPSARLRVFPNRPVTRGFLVTTLDFRDDRWFVNVDLDLRISKGVVDSIRVDIPRQLAAALTLDPDLPKELQETSDPDRQIVLVRPTKELRGATHLRLQSSWQTPDGERTRAPDVRALGVSELDRYLIVPTRLGRQQIAWETSGLQSASLPPTRSDAPVDTDGKTVFQVVGSRPEATVRDVDRVTGAPQVHLADILLSWRLDGTCYGVTTFDLEPARLSEVELAIPPDFELVQVTVAGLPVTVKHLDNEHWRVRLGPEQLPQRIEVLFTGKLPRITPLVRGQRFAAPLLVGLPVMQTLWSIQGPPNVAGGRPELAHIESGPLSLSQVRAENACALLHFASEVVAQSATKEMDTWRSAWQRRLDNALRQIQRNQQADPAAWIPDESEGTQGNDEPSATPFVNEMRAGDPASVWHLQQEPLGTTSYGSLLGSSNNLYLGYAPADFSDLGRRGLMATVLFGLAALVALARRSRAVSEWALRWPYAAGVLFGIAWWLWLSPSLLGLVIILVSVIGAFRSSWSTR
ncbi:MAG: hypothetical protein ACC628_01570 [Pirellulaceae bacterium]